MGQFTSNDINISKYECIVMDMTWYTGKKSRSKRLHFCLGHILMWYICWNELELELENCLFDKKKYKHDTISHRIHDSMFFLSGDPYKGAERTACVRATHGYYNA